MTEQLGCSLARVLELAIGTLHPAVTVEPLSRTDWASVTFSGARHRLRAVLRGTGAVGAAADFLDVMDELDLPIAGHIVADIALVSEERCDEGCYACLLLEALTIEDC